MWSKLCGRCIEFHFRVEEDHRSHGLSKSNQQQVDNRFSSGNRSEAKRVLPNLTCSEGFPLSSNWRCLWLPTLTAQHCIALHNAKRLTG